LHGLAIQPAKKAMPEKGAGQAWPLRAYLAKKRFNFGDQWRADTGTTVENEGLSSLLICPIYLE
jgi:hypothetical protein